MASGSKRGRHPDLLGTALVAEHHGAAFCVHRDVWQDDVEVVLCIRRDAQPDMQAAVGSAIHLVHGVVSRQNVEASVERVSDFPYERVPGIDFEKSLEHLRETLSLGLERP